MEKIIFYNGKETNYLITDDGRIFNRKTRRELKGTLAGREYQAVNLIVEGKQKAFQVHRLVAEAFCENPNNYTIVDHINRDKLDNRAENLRWASASENAINCIKKKSEKPLPNVKDFSKFKPIPGLQDYLCSADGQIINKITGYQYRHALVNGYHRVSLNKKNYRVHRLVYSAWIGPLEDGKEIDHIDGNKDNNHYTNLRSVAHSENMNNAYSNGHKGRIGVSQFSLDGKFLKHYDSIQDAADTYQLTQAAIKTACNYGTKSANHYWLRDDSITTSEEFCTPMPDNAIPYGARNNTLFCNNNFYSRISKHCIPQFEDKNGRFCYLSTNGGSYKKEYFSIEKSDPAIH